MGPGLKKKKLSTMVAEGRNMNRERAKRAKEIRQARVKEGKKLISQIKKNRVKLTMSRGF